MSDVMNHYLDMGRIMQRGWSAKQWRFVVVTNWRESMRRINTDISLRVVITSMPIVNGSMAILGTYLTLNLRTLQSRGRSIVPRTFVIHLLAKRLWILCEVVLAIENISSSTRMWSVSIATALQSVSGPRRIN